MYRRPKNQQEYKKSNKSQREHNKCPFCTEDNALNIKEYQYFYIRRNKFSYELWDRREVEDHLMIIPRVHIEGFEHLPDESMEEYGQILKEYQSQGYDFFTRSNDSTIKSQPHLHTHLIKTNGNQVKYVHYEHETDILDFEILE